MTPINVCKISCSITGSIKDKFLIEFWTNVAIAVFKPQLIGWIMTFLLVHNYFSSTTAVSTFNVQHFAIQSALDEEVLDWSVKFQIDIIIIGSHDAVRTYTSQLIKWLNIS